MLTLRELKAAMDAQTADIEAVMRITGATRPRDAVFAGANLLRLLDPHEPAERKAEARAWLADRGLLPEDLADPCAERGEPEPERAA